VKEGEVGIEESLRIDADALAREVNAIDEAAVVRRVFASLDALANVDVGASVPGRPVGAAGPRPGDQPDATEATGESSDSDLDDDAERSPGLSGLTSELRRCVRGAEAGDPSSARRVAELLELAGQDADAAAWWYLAADLGDPDAIDYVSEILDRDSPPSEGTFTESKGWGGRFHHSECRFPDIWRSMSWLTRTTADADQCGDASSSIRRAR
jgi:hypothetical protein